MKGKSLILLVSIVLAVSFLGHPSQPTQAAESFTAKWQTNPQGDKIDEGKSKTYNLTIENKTSDRITIKVSSSSSGIEIYPKSQEVPGKGGLVAKIKVTMPKRNDAVKAYFSVTVTSSKGDSKTFKFYIIYRFPCCTWNFGWVRSPHDVTVVKNTVNTFKFYLKNTCDSESVSFKVASQTTAAKTSDHYFTVKAGEIKYVEVTTYTPRDLTGNSYDYVINIKSDCSDLNTVRFRMFFRD
jgi:archaellum component FlaG (FlaF/FlaG flagellin family)